MLLQTNSYVVPKEKRAEHARLVRKFRQTLNRLGCDQFDVFEQVGANWGGGETTGRFVQMMRFRDRKHQLSVQNFEKSDPAAQQLIAEFCELINFPYQQQQGLFAVGFYQSVLPVAPLRYGTETGGYQPPAASDNGAGLHVVEEAAAGEEARGDDGMESEAGESDVSATETGGEDRGFFAEAPGEVSGEVVGEASEESLEFADPGAGDGSDAVAENETGNEVDNADLAGEGIESIVDDTESPVEDIESVFEDDQPSH